VILWEKGHLRVATILRQEPCKLVVRDQGVRATRTLKGTECAPELDQGKGAVRLEHPAVGRDQALVKTDEESGPASSTTASATSRMS
jgi:hypothetical protein